MALCVVLDTNVLLSGVAYPASLPGRIVAAWRGGSLQVCLSPYILDGLRRVLPKLRAKHGLSDAEIADLVDCLSFEADSLTPEPHHAPELTDPFDQAILGTLLAAEKQFQAKYLVTGDKALLACASRYTVLSPAEFWAIHGAG